MYNTGYPACNENCNGCFAKTEFNKCGILTKVYEKNCPFYKTVEQNKHDRIKYRKRY